ncbi:hypothetical protein [Moraxella bovoculi]|uniref:hypothetical protein n=1 Tax=Moraxella bovoculi TaxID=386891 RepID=UPI0013C320B4|nr:hypothetical protein [Moraxella bovoculi]
MKLNNEILANREFISLAKVAGVIDNTATTNLTSVQPNRHTLAIFTPRHSTGVNKSSLQDTFTVSSVYGGLIEPNKILFLGNKFSRMLAVVETRQPFLWLAKLTKLTGASIMTANAILSHSLAVLTAEYEHYSAMHANNPYMGYADRANAIYNAIQALKQHASQSDSTNTQPKHQNALQRIWGALVSFGGVR